MSTMPDQLTPRERELGAIITAYNEVTDRLKLSHEQLTHQVQRLREELHRKNEQLRRRERLAALGEMAAGVAHEIRNPLGGIRVFASLLQKDLQDRPEALRLVDKMARGVSQLESVVADTLEFARPSSPSPNPVPLDRLVAETLELAAGKLESCTVKVQIEESVRKVELVTDPDLLRRALLNLIVNAAEAAHRPDGGGIVQVTCDGSHPEHVDLAVRDNGPGIAPDAIDRIFNPFFTTRDTGTGLGLAIVHQIVEALGGAVQAANGDEGGAVFTLCLPRTLSCESETHEEAD